MRLFSFSPRAPSRGETKPAGAEHRRARSNRRSGQTVFFATRLRAGAFDPPIVRVATGGASTERLRCAAGYRVLFSVSLIPVAVPRPAARGPPESAQTICFSGRYSRAGRRPERRCDRRRAGNGHPTVRPPATTVTNRRVSSSSTNLPGPTPFGSTPNGFVDTSRRLDAGGRAKMTADFTLAIAGVQESVSR